MRHEPARGSRSIRLASGRGPRGQGAEGGDKSRLPQPGPTQDVIWAHGSDAWRRCLSEASIDVDPGCLFQTDGHKTISLVMHVSPL